MVRVKKSDIISFKDFEVQHVGGKCPSTLYNTDSAEDLNDLTKLQSGYGAALLSDSGSAFSLLPDDHPDLQLPSDLSVRAVDRSRARKRKPAAPTKKAAKAAPKATKRAAASGVKAAKVTKAPVATKRAAPGARRSVRIAGAHLTPPVGLGIYLGDEAYPNLAPATGYHTYRNVPATSPPEPLTPEQIMDLVWAPLHPLTVFEQLPVEEAVSMGYFDVTQFRKSPPKGQRAAVQDCSVEEARKRSRAEWEQEQEKMRAERRSRSQDREPETPELGAQGKKRKYM